LDIDLGAGSDAPAAKNPPAVRAGKGKNVDRSRKSNRSKKR
jgi:hypothetical protein